MAKGLIAKASVTIDVPRKRVWAALVDPHAIKEYLFGTQVESDWKQGSPILWKGEWQGRRYEDKGVVLKLEPGQRMQYSHFSPLSGLPDEPQNYHTVTIELADEGGATSVSLSQDNNRTDEVREHSEQNWEQVLSALKRLLEAD